MGYSPSSLKELDMIERLTLRGRRRSERSYSTFKVRRGGSEEIPLIQGKEQRLCFAGAAARVATREESGVLGFPSRRGLTPQGSLECNPDKLNKQGDNIQP